jgi:hypothetical protein
MSVTSEKAKRPQPEGDSGPSQLDLLMRDLGATRWDPTPIDQHDFFLDDIPGESSLQRALAWMRAHTLRRGRWKAYAVDEKGNELHIEHLAADLDWKVKWAQQVWRLGEAYGLFRREKQNGARLYLNGKVTRRTSHSQSDGCRGPSRCTTASSRLVLPRYVQRQLAKLDPNRHCDFLDRIQIERQRGRQMVRDAMADVRAIVDQREESLFAEFGLYRMRGAKRRKRREPMLVQVSGAQGMVEAFAANPNANGTAVEPPSLVSTAQLSQETAVQGGLDDEIPEPVQRSEAAIQPPRNETRVVVDMTDEAADEVPRLEPLETCIGRTDPSSSDLRGATTTKSSSGPNGPDLTPIDAEARRVCNPEARFARQLFDACRAKAPSCTVEQVVGAIEDKIAIKRGRTVVNWIGYLLTAVPLCFEGEAFLQFRASVAASKRPPQEKASAYQADEWRAYLEHNASSLPAGYEDIAASLRKLITDHARLADGHADLVALEQRLNALEEEMLATARARQSAVDVLESSREVDRQLRQYRGKMTADHLSLLEKQYRERDLLERARLPRLSLYYAR